MLQTIIAFISGILFFYTGLAQQSNFSVDHFNTQGENLVVNGYDLVSYFSESKPVKGKQSISTDFQGLLLYFSSQENKRKFIDHLLDQFEKLDSNLDQQSLQFENCLSQSEGKKHRILTSFSRELAYCLDHCIHHQYFIKIGLHSVDQKHILHDEFGIAPSTLMYRRSNVHS